MLHRGARTLSRIGLEDIHATFWQRNRTMFCPEILSNVEFKGNGLISLAEEILRQYNVQTDIITSLFLARFTVGERRRQSRKDGEMCNFMRGKTVTRDIWRLRRGLREEKLSGEH